MRKPSLIGLWASVAFAFAGLTSCTPPVQAEESEVAAGHGLFCNTAEQVEAFIARHDKDNQAGLIAINERFGQNSCGYLTVAYIKGDEAASVTTEEGIVSVIKVNVVGVQNGAGWVHLAQPVPQFVAILRRADSV